MAEEKSISQEIVEVARRLAEELPEDLMVRVVAQKLNEALDNLAGTWGPDNIRKIIEEAVNDKVDALLKGPEFEPRVREIATQLANEALFIAKNNVKVGKKGNRW